MAQAWEVAQAREVGPVAGPANPRTRQTPAKGGVAPHKPELGLAAPTQGKPVPRGGRWGVRAAGPPAAGLTKGWADPLRGIS